MTCLTHGNLNGIAVVVSGSIDGSIFIWEAIEHTPLQCISDGPKSMFTHLVIYVILFLPLRWDHIASVVSDEVTRSSGDVS